MDAILDLRVTEASILPFGHVTSSCIRSIGKREEEAQGMIGSKKRHALDFSLSQASSGQGSTIVACTEKRDLIMGHLG